MTRDRDSIKSTDVLEIQEFDELPSEEMPVEAEGTALVVGKRIALAGRLGSMNQREAGNLLKSYGATIVDLQSDRIDWANRIDWIVIGAEESPLAEQELLSQPIRDAAGRGEVEIIHESDLWPRLGLVDAEQSMRQSYTPAMLAHLLGVPIHVVRRWHRRGLITPIRTMHRLPYFDFQEVATAKRLALWVASGDSPRVIEQRLVDLIEVLPDLKRPLDQLSILIEGKQVLLRQGEGLVEPGGQQRFDFADMDATAHVKDADDANVVLPINAVKETSAELRITAGDDQDELLRSAFEAEDADELEQAIECCHAILARDGPRPDINFQLGELLYRIDEPIAARERYYIAIELDPDFVEARASLGLVLAEIGQDELAVAALRGVLSLHEDYSDVHYHLAKILTHLQRDIEALTHWKRFVELAPDSPWVSEAETYLS